MLSGCFAAKGAQRLHSIEGPMDRAVYCKILKKVLLPLAKTLKRGNRWVSSMTMTQNISLMKQRSG